MGHDQEDATGGLQPIHHYINYINYGTQNVANGGQLNGDNRDYKGSVYPYYSPLLSPSTLPNICLPPFGLSPMPSPGPTPHLGINPASSDNPQNAESGTGENQQSDHNSPRAPRGYSHSYRPLASIQFEDGSGKHIRVYSQDLDLNIVEMFYDDTSSGTGWNERQNYIVGRARLNTGLAATCWNAGTEIRVYYINDHGTLVERAYSGRAGGDWYDGNMTGRFLPAPYSKLSAFNFPYGQEQHVRVFYQDIDNHIQEALFRRGDWEIGSPLPISLPGTSIAATGRPDKTWVYAQMADLSIKEIWWEYSSGWKAGASISARSYAAGAPLALVVLHDSEVWVFAIDETNSVHVIQWDGNRSKTIEITPSGSALPFSALSALSISEFLRTSVRLYFQSVETDVMELMELNGDVKRKIRIPGRAGDHLDTFTSPGYQSVDLDATSKG
ncbi:fucose-specific lectin [Pluteus cervinus]|uniref:Fucose-specific lectin n=1 Tax=Pluteus cervinus TaxID=181527 RepID=A0ACD3AF83_9AGAR|nr:fucose-specific lectin [Pluteus cervinus]